MKFFGGKATVILVSKGFQKLVYARMQRMHLKVGWIDEVLTPGALTKRTNPILHGIDEALTPVALIKHTNEWTQQD